MPRAMQSACPPARAAMFVTRTRAPSTVPPMAMGMNSPLLP
jgi:hypothetical protein